MSRVKKAFETDSNGMPLEMGGTMMTRGKPLRKCRSRVENIKVLFENNADLLRTNERQSCERSLKLSVVQVLSSGASSS